MAERESDRELVVTRVFDAPRELVWKAWTDPAQVVKWWGPNGFTTTTHAMDVRPGGSWRYVMHGPDGTDYPNRIDFLEVAPPERLVYDQRGDADAVQFRTTVTFTEHGGKTEVTMRGVFESAAELRRVDKKYRAIEGAEQHITRLGEHLAAMRAA